MLLEIKKLAKEGMSISEIAKKLDIKYAKAYNLIKSNNIMCLDGRKKPDKNRGLWCRKILDDKEVSELYLAGNSLSELSGIFNVNRITIFNSLVRSNTRTRPSTNRDDYVVKPPKLDRDTLYELYWNQSLSLAKIARLHDYNNSESVKRDMLIHGIDRRSYKEAGKVLYSDPARRELTAAINRRISYDFVPGGETSIERRFREWCETNNVEFVFQFKIPDSDVRHNYDFYLPKYNLIVETDGDYWHLKEEAIKRDCWFDSAAKKHGYKIIRFLSSTIEKTKNECFNTIKDMENEITN